MLLPLLDQELQCDILRAEYGFRPMKKYLFAYTSGIALSMAAALNAQAYDATRIGECYFMQSPNSTPVQSLDGCEVVSSTAQGSYYYEIRFNAKRQYVIQGGNDRQARDVAPASLNGKPAKYHRSNGYQCWKKTDPYHEVCFR